MNFNSFWTNKMLTFCIQFKAPIKPFKNQNYDELKSRHSESHLFEDPLFPANNSSLYFTQMPPQGIQWLRPKVFIRQYS